MKVLSYISEVGGLVPVEVELSLWPGLPTIVFLGRADQHLKESAFRIKSAIKAQGFDFPKSKQILINLRPSHLKKTSRGIELAVAVAFLWESGQIQAPLRNDDYFIYGELGLGGDVYEPEDLHRAFGQRTSTVLTGVSRDLTQQEFNRHQISNLREILNPRWIQGRVMGLSDFRRPPALNLHFSPRQARLLSIVGFSGANLFIAGPAGCGKTTLAGSLHQLLPTPTSSQWVDIKEIQRSFAQSPTYLPLVKPHHTTPVMSMVGGGATPLAGEVSRAHGGLLLLDEFLEFKGQVQEALREPLEDGRIRVARAGRVQVFPAQFQCVATANLCPCGDLTPESVNMKSCRYSMRRCHSYLEKLSGPILDRFDILYFAKHESMKTVGLHEIFERIQRVRESSKMEEPVNMTGFWAERVESTQISERRKISIRRICKAICLLDGKSHVDEAVLQEAYQLCFTPFEKIKTFLG